jgi:hypothetical protein
MDGYIKSEFKTKRIIKHYMNLDLYQIIADIEVGKEIPKKYHKYFTDIKSIYLNGSFLCYNEYISYIRIQKVDIFYLYLVTLDDIILFLNSNTDIFYLTKYNCIYKNKKDINLYVKTKNYHSNIVYNKKYNIEKFNIIMQNIRNKKLKELIELI